MTGTKTIIKFALPLIIFLLASCEGNTDREWSVENASSTTIQVWAVLGFGTDSIYESIETGETKIITITNESKANSEPQHAYDVFSDFLVTNADGDTLRKNLLDNDSWDIYIEQTKHRPDHFYMTYTLIVKDEHFGK